MRGGTSSGAARRASRSVALALSVVAVVFGLAACDPTDRVLTVRLHDSAGSGPAANVTVAVIPSSAPGSEPVATGITDDAGVVHFTAPVLGAGTYVLRFGSPAHQFDGDVLAGSDNERWWNGTADDAAASPDGATPVHVDGSNPVDVTESYAVPRGSIRNSVYTSTGEPLNGLVVTAHAWPSGKVIATTRTNASGTYAFTGLPAQNYKIGIARSGTATFYAGLTASDQTHILDDAAEIPALVEPHELPGGPTVVSDDGVIRGRTLDGTTPVPGVVVLVFTSANQFVTSVTTNGNANFNISGLPTGSYRLLAYDPDGRYAATVHGSPTPDLSGGTLVATSSVPAPNTRISMGGLDCPRAQGGDGQLVGADLRNCDLRNANLTGANLTDADLTRADLTGADLTRAQLTRTIVNGTDLTDATLYRVKARELVADPGPAALPQHWGIHYGALFGPYADLTNVQMGGFRYSIPGVSLRGANLNGAGIFARDILRGVQISEATFEGAELRNQVLYGYLHDINLRGARLSGITFDGAVLDGIDLSFAELGGLEMQGVSFKGITAAGTTGSTSDGGANWQEDAFSAYWRWDGLRFVPQGPGNTLANTDYTGSGVLRGRNLAGWNMTNIKLADADLTGTDLTGATMTGADIRGADLSDARLDGVISDGVTADADTVLPAGWAVVGGVLVKG
jgi:uncharacterized protein YjbI with pentapeptide repeats